MLINLYILALVLGALLLGASLFFGDTQADLEVDAEAEADAEVPRPSEIGQLDGVDASGGAFFLRTVRSLRFWTFFVAFFGMTGLVLDGLDLMAPAVALVVAIAMGAAVGASANAAVRIFSAGR